MRKSEFVRTPKFNITNADKSVKKGNYIKAKLKPQTIWEGVFMTIFILAILDGLFFGITDFLTFHLMLAFGYGSIFVYTLKHLYSKQQ
jgi:hypothetical protein